MTSQAEDKAVVITTITLTPEQHVAFKRVAASNHRTMAGQVRAWIEAEDTPAVEPAEEAA